MPYDDLARDKGRVLAEKRIALYRDPQGQLHALSSVCTHRACDVEWNDVDKVWDCPCHGSRFTPAGEVVNGPAVKPLPAARVPE